MLFSHGFIELKRKLTEKDTEFRTLQTLVKGVRYYYFSTIHKSHSYRPGKSILSKRKP